MIGKCGLFAFIIIVAVAMIIANQTITNESVRWLMIGIGFVLIIVSLCCYKQTENMIGNLMTPQEVPSVPQGEYENTSNFTDINGDESIIDDGINAGVNFPTSNRDDDDDDDAFNPMLPGDGSQIDVFKGSQKLVNDGKTDWGDSAITPQVMNPNLIADAAGHIMRPVVQYNKNAPTDMMRPHPVIKKSPCTWPINYSSNERSHEHKGLDNNSSKSTSNASVSGVDGVANSHGKV